jgi:hypothetical protein
MTIEDIESNLPNGFHDAILKKICIDYEKNEAFFDIDLDSSVPDSPDDDTKENVFSRRLFLSGLVFCIVEPPTIPYTDSKVRGLWIASSGAVKPEQRSKGLPESIPDGAFVHFFFINNWNASIYLAAMDAWLQ